MRAYGRIISGPAGQTASGGAAVDRDVLTLNRSDPPAFRHLMWTFLTAAFVGERLEVLYVWCATGVVMSRSSLRIYEGKSYSLSAAVSPADATDKSLYWGSSNPDIATVDQNGKVTGKAPGVCTIFAQAQDGSKVFASCVVRVLRWYPGATPITGDSSHLGLWIGVLAVSACAIGAAAFILIKKRKKKSVHGI